METDNLMDEILGTPEEYTPIEEIPSETSPEPAKYQITPYADRAPHATQLEKSERVEEIADMLLHHKSNAEIKKFIAEKHGISENTVTNYISDANKLIQEQVPEIKSIIAKNIDTYRRIIKDSESDDKRTTILAMAGLEKLLRLHGPDTQNNTQINLNFENVDTEELVELIKSISPSGGK
jgi:DNA-binding CsgD family transcriptional regulator